MHILPVTDRAALDDFQVVHAAVYDHDFTWLPADPVEERLHVLAGTPTAGELSLLFVAYDGDVSVGDVELSLPTLDNLETAQLEVGVHPDHRRQGHGRALLAFGIDEVRRRGRTRAFLQLPSDLDGSPPVAAPLMDEVGARPVLVDVRRLLGLAEALPSEVPDGYRVEQWVDGSPEELVDGLAYLVGRMILDAPMGEMDYEQEKWDAARYREKEAATAAQGRRLVGTAVVHEATGCVAGLTDIGVNASRPQVAYQWETIVDPDHRGHRLGMVLKSWNHAQLTRVVPEARVVNTWNAESNTYMISVNDLLGFRPMERWTEYQLDL